MDLDLATSLLQSSEALHREEGARSLGRSLAAHRSGDWIVGFRRMTTKLQKSASSDHQRGFLEALELVATGFQRQAEADELDDQELVKIQSRAHWVSALRLLKRGPMRPSDLKAALAIQASAVSRLLDDLEESDLITRVKKGKERPCKLSPHGHFLLNRLTEEPKGAIEPAVLVSAVVQCVGVLARDGRVSRSLLLDLLRGDVATEAPRVLSMFEDEMKGGALVFSDDDDTLVATETELFTRLSGHLSLGCAEKASVLVDKLRELTAQERLYLRAGERLREWDVLASKIPNLKVLRRDNLHVLDLPEQGGYRILYESPSLFEQDRRIGTLPQKALHRFCLGLERNPTLGDVQLIQVPMPELVA